MTMRLYRRFAASIGRMCRTSPRIKPWRDREGGWGVEGWGRGERRTCASNGSVHTASGSVHTASARAHFIPELGGSTESNNASSVAVLAQLNADVPAALEAISILASALDSSHAGNASHRRRAPIWAHGLSCKSHARLTQGQSRLPWAIFAALARRALSSALSPGHPHPSRADGCALRPANQPQPQ